MPDVFGLNTLLAELVLALGAALVAGNGLALWRARRPSVPSGRLHAGRAVFLAAVGVLMVAWGTASLLGG